MSPPCSQVCARKREPLSATPNSISGFFVSLPRHVAKVYQAKEETAARDMRYFLLPSPHLPRRLSKAFIDSTGKNARAESAQATQAPPPATWVPVSRDFNQAHVCSAPQCVCPINSVISCPRIEQTRWQRQSFHVCHFSRQRTHAAALTHFTMQELINTLDETRKQVRAHGDQMQATRQELLRRLRSKEEEVLDLQSFMPIMNETNLCCYILLFLGLC